LHLPANAANGARFTVMVIPGGVAAKMDILSDFERHMQ
jgi:putative intracellular protease/amidase